MSHLLVSLTKDPLSTLLSGGLTAGLGNGAVLICGSGVHVGEGCGKTSLAHALCRQLQQWPVCAHVTIIDCIPLRGEISQQLPSHSIFIPIFQVPISFLYPITERFFKNPFHPIISY